MFYNTIYFHQRKSGRPGFDFHFYRGFFFPGLNHTSDFKIGTPLAILSSVWRDRVSAGIG